MARQRNVNPFTTSHLRIARQRFSRKSRLQLALFLILALPALILLPGSQVSSTRTKTRVKEEVLPPPHPPYERRAVAVKYRNPRLHTPLERKKEQQKQKVLEEDTRFNDLSISPASVVDTNISAVVLFHNEYPTLNHTLQTWGKLMPQISDMVFFLNGIASGAEFKQKLPILTTPAFAHHRVILSQKNLALGLAITEMVRQAKHDTVLLLEKDWALIEGDVGDVLAQGKTLLEKGVHVVRLRHREFPGAPLHARMMHEGREESILKEQKNLFCYVHHWIKNPVEKYPDYFTVCPGMGERDGVWCAKAKYCQWTNNPALFKKEWFLNELGERFERDYLETKKTNPRSNMLDFEFYTNWKGEVWNDRNIAVALPRGLFEHQEVRENGVMNTVWYAWTRLQKDVDEKRHVYLQDAQRRCEGESDLGRMWRFDERYPVEFVRHYSYTEAMNRSMDDGVEELRREAVRLRRQLEDGHGTWRNGVTDLTNLWYKISLFVYPVEARDMRIAFVTALFHTEEEEDGGRGFRDDVETTAANLDALSNYALVVYCTSATQTTLKQSLKLTYDWDEENFAKIRFVVMEFDAMLDKLLTKENVERIKKLRKTSNYRARVRNRTHGIPPEKALMLAHAKPYILDDAMQQAHETHLIWFDSASPCIKTSRGGKTGSGASISNDNDAIIRSQLFLHAFVTGIQVSSENELQNAMTGSGFDTAVFLKHMEKLPGADVGLVDMKTFGGSRMSIALLTGYYDIVLRNLLRDGQLGSGREALSIGRNNVKYHFRFFDGLNGCSKNIDQTHACEKKQVLRSYMSDGSLAGCQLYRWIGECG